VEPPGLQQLHDSQDGRVGVERAGNEPAADGPEEAEDKISGQDRIDCGAQQAAGSSFGDGVGDQLTERRHLGFHFPSDCRGAGFGIEVLR
jgi:hypothetical protein